MGSGSSRMGSRPPRSRSRSDNGPKLNFAAFLCGGAPTSSSPPQVEGQQSEKLTLPARRLHDSKSDDDLQCRENESPLASSECSSSCSLNEHLSSSPNIDDTFVESSMASQSADTSYPGKYSSETMELVPCLSGGSSGLDISHSRRTRNVASTSSKPAHLEPLSTNINTNFVSADETSDPVNDSVSLPSDTSETEIHASGSTHSESISLSASNLLVEEPHLEANSSDAEFPTVGERRDGNILHVDVVNISSNALRSGTGDVNGNEARRNRRRQFWDAFSRRNRTRRNYDYPGMEDHDDIGSPDRWLLDIGDDLLGSRFDYDSVYLRRRSHGSSGRRWHARSEIRERLRGGFQNDTWDTTFCPSGLHPEGTCICNSLFINEESSTRASISRIVLLAEALFEVLDEIHRQPGSLSLSMVSLPAPESVVNSLPVKSHIKHDAAAGSTDDVEQCYICLAEYEEGDKIRLLPCRHEYHMYCVDKWLKETHGVCPLCRRDVCEGTAEITTEVAM